MTRYELRLSVDGGKLCGDYFRNGAPLPPPEVKQSRLGALVDLTD
ncbi:MAG: hypothetical protein WDO13_21135 [Verrucomicrobiota bacterium]